MTTPTPAPKALTRNQRTVRTIVQLLIATATAVPTILAGAPSSVVVGQVVVVATAVTHYFSLIEQIPGFPAWLKVAG